MRVRHHPPIHLVVRDFGAALQVSFISRYDQIHFKLYAAAYQGVGILPICGS